MKWFKKCKPLQLLLLMNILFSASVSDEIPEKYCGDIRIQEPFFLHQNSSYSPLLSQTILCKSHKLYFRTSIGLFQINSIDYNNKLIIVSHTSCSPTSNFVSPHHLSAGFPPPPTSNSLILFNCSNRSSETPLVPCNNTMLSGFCGSTSTKKMSSCSVIDDDVEKRRFDPKQMDCTHYSRVYTSSSEKIELGTRICFDIPDHVPNPCDQCEKSDGNCGVGLRCACHPKKCSEFNSFLWRSSVNHNNVILLFLFFFAEDKVRGAALRPCGNIFVCLVFLVVVVVFLYGF